MKQYKTDHLQGDEDAQDPECDEGDEDNGRPKKAAKRGKGSSPGAKGRIMTRARAQKADMQTSNDESQGEVTEGNDVGEKAEAEDERKEGEPPDEKAADDAEDADLAGERENEDGAEEGEGSPEIEE